MPVANDDPITAHENGHDYEIRVFYGQLGIRVATLNDEGITCEVPHLSSDQARKLASCLIQAANMIDVL